MKRLLLTATALGVVLVAVLAWNVRAGAQESRAFGPDVLASYGFGATIGASVRELGADDAARAKLPSRSGVVIDDVRENGPAARAGLRQGDIVTEFDGERVRSVRQFTRLVRETPPDRTVTARIVRDGSTQAIDLQPEAGGVEIERRFTREVERGLRNLPRNFNFDFDFDFPSGGVFGPQARLGARLSPLTDQLAGYFGVKEGVLVTSVTADSAASRAGLRAGDVITSVNGRTAADPGAISEAVREAKPGSTIEIKVMRDRKEVTLTGTVPEQPDRRRVRRPGLPV